MSYTIFYTNRVTYFCFTLIVVCSYILKNISYDLKRSIKEDSQA
jgi:hypothetical protein